MVLAVVAVFAVQFVYVFPFCVSLVVGSCEEWCERRGEAEKLWFAPRRPPSL